MEKNLVDVSWVKEAGCKSTYYLISFVWNSTPGLSIVIEIRSLVACDRYGKVTAEERKETTGIELPNLNWDGDYTVYKLIKNH